MRRRLKSDGAALLCALALGCARQAPWRPAALRANLPAADTVPSPRVPVPVPVPDPALPPAEPCEPLDPASFALDPVDETIFHAPIPALVDSSARVMAPLYERIARLLRGRAQAPIRIGIYGDSNMTMDGISGGMRRMLQAKLGDAGHGFVALGRAWPWYLHMDVKHGSSYRLWKRYTTSDQRGPDAYYGFANLAFESTHRGASTYVATADDDAPVGQSVSTFDAYFLKRPGGGAFHVAIDGKQERVVSAAAPSIVAGFERFVVPDGPHRLEIVVDGNEPVRVFGVTLERDEPGVVVDSLGTGALNYEQMTRVDHETRRAMLERRQYDLVIFLLGANVYPATEAVLTGWVRAMVEAQREAVPALPILILSPPDIAASLDAKTSLPRIVAIAHMLRRAAAASGAAFWDFWSAMGGNLSMVQLRKQNGMASSDLVHLTRASGQMLGQRLAHALMDDFGAYVAAHPRAGCAPP